MHKPPTRDELKELVVRAKQALDALALSVTTQADAARIAQIRRGLHALDEEQAGLYQRVLDLKAVPFGAQIPVDTALRLLRATGLPTIATIEEVVQKALEILEETP